MDDAGKGHGATGALLPEPRCHPPEKVTHGRTCGVIVAISPRPPHPRISPMGHGPWTSHHLTPHDLVYPKSDRLSSSSDQSLWLPQSTVHHPPSMCTACRGGRGRGCLNTLHLHANCDAVELNNACVLMIWFGRKGRHMGA
jgi:hypothetical protein